MTLSLAKDKIRFVLLEGIHPQADALLTQAGYENIQRVDGAVDADQLNTLIRDAHFLGIRSRTQLDAEALSKAERLIGIGCFCIGTDQVSLADATAAGVPVFNAPFANTRSVAELVLAEIILLMRGIPERNAAAHRGEWLKHAVGSHEVRGKTLGIVGYGHIGSQLGILAEGLGMRVTYYDIISKLPLGNATPMATLDELLQRSDVVSLHVPETPETESMIGAKQIHQMRLGTHLINASRGRVVDLSALKAALTSGHIASAAIDVFPSEPKNKDQRFENELCGLDNVLLTPHIGGSTQEAQENIARDVIGKLIRYSDNGSTTGAVNFPEVALPDHAGARRIMHIHRNEPGVLNAINTLISEQAINIAAQYLQTQSDLGYVVMDVETKDTSSLIKALSEIPGTIKTRTLY
ncbi:MAG TPA: phosphoglycerate dehydrogenase [Wenzhouxiangella sp.]